MRLRELAPLTLVVFQTAACSSTPEHEKAADAGKADATEEMPDGGSDAAPVNDAAASGIPAALCDGGMCIQHLIVIVQENHTFDDHFGGYCTAAPGSNPTCNLGPACCEAMPATDPAGTKPTILTDAEHGNYDPIHLQACELSEMDNGKMDMYATASCGSVENVAIADTTIIAPLWNLAAKGALADRYFQPIAGQSSSNDMYLARANYVFTDNDYAPESAVGMTCDSESTAAQYTDKTIGDLLTAASVSWTFFADGYQAMVTAAGACPPHPSDCPFPFQFYPCAFDPSDIPFEYYPTSRDNPATMQDYSVLEAALTSGTGLPEVSFVKAIGYKSEHPGTGNALSVGVDWAAALINQIESSAYGSSTLVLLTYDEGGGYFDHVTPPAANTVDNQPYGTRIPLMAIGAFTQKNYVSHVVMEHSSIVKFIEWNWLGQKTGQLGTRDTNVANIGSLLDPAMTGVTVPAD